MTYVSELGAVSKPPDCHYGDHQWNGTSQCVRCGERLRCMCGCYVREDNTEHYKRCPVIEAMDASCPLCEGGRGTPCGWHFS